jgi:hypothetical protein
MPRSLRRHLTPGNTMAGLALFVALGGSSYAALRIDGSQIENRSISGTKLKRNTLSGTTIRETRLRKVPRARRADLVGGRSAAALSVRCPEVLEPVSGVCAERAWRAPAAYGLARIECDALGRRLPTYEELANLVSGAGLSVAPQGELTSSVFVSGPDLRVVTVENDAGEASSVVSTFGGRKPFRCVAYRRN